MGTALNFGPNAGDQDPVAATTRSAVRSSPRRLFRFAGWDTIITLYPHKVGGLGLSREIAVLNPASALIRDSITRTPITLTGSIDNVAVSTTRRQGSQMALDVDCMAAAAMRRFSAFNRTAPFYAANADCNRAADEPAAAAIVRAGTCGPLWRHSSPTFR
jgi:hypothetical protein